MPIKNFPLPTYPAKTDMWDELKNESRPIMVYGMGNGADKLFERFAQLGITVSEVFASDGFVRGHSFRGKKVRSFSEIKENYPEFVIVLSFASNREDVVSMLSEINDEYDMYVPDMPIADVSEYFDKEFYNTHYNEIVRAYESLFDDESRAIFSSIVNYRLSGRMNYLLECYTDRDDMYSVLPCDKIIRAVDAGAYNGDTAREMKSYFSNLESIVALEPDKKTFKRLLKYSEAESEIAIKTINAAAWCEDTDGRFFGSGNRNSTAVATASFEHSEDAVKMVKIDTAARGRIDYIKYDVEGAEREAIMGSREIIHRDEPSLLVSLYHRSRDIFELINYFADNYPSYDLHLCRLKCLPAWEINLLAVKSPKGM